MNPQENLPDPRVSYFDSLAESWDRREPSAETMIQGLVRHCELLGLGAGQDLLEVGCGTGKTTGWLVEQVAPGRVTAVDFAAAMIAVAERKGIDAEFRCLDVCRDELGSELYDVVFCFHSFPHFRDQAAALRNFSRAMRRTGRLIVMHLAGREQINAFHDSLGGAVHGDHLPSRDQWNVLLESVGLQLNRWIDREDLFFLDAARP